ncbi:MAG: NAD(P)/FAD-dependent oxidoreductase [Deltaproteobacteria bacterium]|nr:NAD(P)/FAD-dependent oxidoreductase [Deltaproteobacteria bacterium]
MSKDRPHVVIVGGGFGGLAAARALRRAPVRVTLVDRRNHHLFQPLLYQVATAGLSPADIAYPIRAVLRRQRNAHVLLAEATAIDAARREVVLKDGRLGYDWLVVATGARHAYFGRDEWEALAPGLKSLEDALEIRRRILLAFEKAEREPDVETRRALLTIVIVGGGPTGIELAGAIAEIAREVMKADFRAIDPTETRVVLVEAGPRVLATFPASLSTEAAAALRERGVEVRTETRVTAIDPGSVAFDGERIAAATVLWAAGVAASPLVTSLGAPLDRAGRLVVAADCSVPDHPEIFVIGDAAAMRGADGAPLPGIAPVAMQQGRYVARLLRGAIAGRPREPFAYRDKGNLATIGRADAVAHIGRLKLHGLLAWILWLVVHILYLVGFRNRVVVLVDWAWAYVTMSRGARLITGDIEPEPAPGARDDRRSALTAGTPAPVPGR